MKLIYNLIFLVLLCFLSACAVSQKERLTASTSEITNALQNLTEIELNINQRHLLQHKQHTKMQDNLSSRFLKTVFLN